MRSSPKIGGHPDSDSPDLHVPDKKHLALNQYKTKREAVTYHYPGMEKTVTERNKEEEETLSIKQQSLWWML